MTKTEMKCLWKRFRECNCIFSTKRFWKNKKYYFTGIFGIIMKISNIDKQKSQFLIKSN